MQALCEIASSRPFSPGLLWKSFLVVLAHYRPNLCLLNQLSAKWSKIANFSVNASLVVGGGNHNQQFTQTVSINFLCTIEKCMYIAMDAAATELFA